MLFNDQKTEPAHILIIDDQPSNVLILREAVRDLGEIHFATSGEAALRAAQREPPDIILLDIEMPEMDGYAVCQAIKADPRLRDVPVIFVTSHTQDANELHALSLGGVDFLQKPLNVPIARARIQTHLALRLRSKQLACAQQDLQDLVQHLPAFVAYWDESYRNILCNDVDGQWFGIPAERMRGMRLQEVLGNHVYAEIEAHLAGLADGRAVSFDLEYMRQDGDMLFGQVSLVCRDQSGLQAGLLMLVTDVTDRKLAETSLHNEKERLRITLNSIGDAVIATDAEGRVNFLNPIAEAMTGWYGRRAIGVPIEQVMPLRDSFDGHVLQNPIYLALKEQRIVGMALNSQIACRDGRVLEVEDSAAPIWDQAGKLTGAIIVFHDVSEARAMALKMTHLAHHDPLTNLPNRMLLQDRTSQALQQAGRNGGQVALFILDLDHFKTINDSVGHSIGDQLLLQLAKRLQQFVRNGDTISRQGGDEFIILIPEIRHVDEVSQLGERLLEACAEPFLLDGVRYDLSMSIGISLYPDDADDQEALYRHADAAMYQAKQEGRGRFRFFSQEIEHTLYARHMLERQMRVAVAEGDFEVHYQPKIDLASQQVVGAEALVRWRRQDGSLISPAQFIPLAEKTGLIVPIGRSVLLKACQEGRRWHEQGYLIHIAVNVSAVQLAQSNFTAMVSEIIEQTGIMPGYLELEITEGVLAKDVKNTFAIINELHKIGVTISIDDFGTGYSSLSYLKQFPIDVLKIDQSFTREILTEKSSAAIVAAIINMAHGLDLRLVAEGVETQAQAELLQQMGCTVMQGYLYSRPLMPERLTEYLQHWRSK